MSNSVREDLSLNDIQAIEHYRSMVSSGEFHPASFAKPDGTPPQTPADAAEIMAYSALISQGSAVFGVILALNGMDDENGKRVMCYTGNSANGEINATYIATLLTVAPDLLRMAEEAVWLRDVVEVQKLALETQRALSKHRSETRDALVRRLDMALNGEKGAARQASLCDIVAQVEDARRNLD